MQRDAALTPKEAELDGYLRDFEAAVRRRQIPALPDFAELQPGTILHQIKIAWGRGEGRDGRRKGYLSEQQIAHEIRTLIGRPYSRSQYQAMFGDGRMAGIYGDRARQPISRDVAKAFAKVALRNWSVDTNGRPTPFPADYDLDDAIEGACLAMFAGREFVYCERPAGQGPFGLYAACGRSNDSIIVATEHEPVIMNDPEVQVVEWLQLIQSLFFPKEVDQAPRDRQIETIHVWTILEPWIASKPESIRAQHGLGKLREVFWIVRNQLAVERAGSERAILWDAIVRRCIVAIKKNPLNQAYRAERLPSEAILSSPFISEESIFPTKVPDNWFRAGDFTSASDKTNSLLRISGTGNAREIRGYYIFTPFPEYPFFSARLMSSPDDKKQADLSFLNLFNACFQYANGNMGTDLDSARKEGWVFKNPIEFLDMSFPIRSQTEEESTPSQKRN